MPTVQTQIVFDKIKRCG